MINSSLFFRPPRPRPEGGQDPSPNFLNEGELPGSAAVAAAGFKENLAPHNSGKKQDDLLIIDSWTGGPTASTAATNEDQNDKFYIRANSVEEKEQSGWGAPPPSNPNGWGQPPPKIGNWQQPPPNVAQPPPQPQQTPQENIYGKPESDAYFYR